MARSNNNNKLKAFVRFDGSGRIIPSSLIVQAFKPKVGNYKEIDAKECCNYTTTTTTTVAPTTTSTTTAAPTTTTSTTVEPTTTTTTTVEPTTTTTTTVPFFSFNVDSARSSSAESCSNYPTAVTQSFSNVATLINGSVIYTDIALTIPFSGSGGDWYGVNNNGTVSAIEISSSGVVSNITTC